MLMPPRYTPRVIPTDERHVGSRRKFLVQLGVISMSAIFPSYAYLSGKLKIEFMEKHKEKKTRYHRVVPRVI
jgi:hypothetical protein